MRIDSPPASAYPGIALQQLEQHHLAAWYAYLVIPQVIEHTSWNLRSEQDLVELLRSYESTAPASPRRLAIVDQANGALAGTIGFHSISEDNRTAEVAYDLAPGFWGRGIATAVCNAVTAWGFSRYEFVRIQATTLDTNTPSQRVLEKCGFRYEGLLRSYRIVRGTPGDFRMYARLSTDSTPL